MANFNDGLRSHSFMHSLLLWQTIARLTHRHPTMVKPGDTID
ncbi:hypothetical protein [Buttiauxella warmboldiae]|nr:hypothetical protein [Buttiauxella warmboldiae]